MSNFYRLAARAGIAPDLLDRLALAMLIMGFAVMAIYAVGMVQNHAVHEAFHDLRHAGGFPCH